MLTGCESELRCEIPLPPSDITRFGFPDVFPSPPEEISAPRDKHSDPSQFPESEHGVEVEVERSWFYYLAEISFRKMMNRAISTLCVAASSLGLTIYMKILSNAKPLKMT